MVHGPQPEIRQVAVRHLPEARGSEEEMKKEPNGRRACIEPAGDCTVKFFIVGGKRVPVRNARHLKQLKKQAADLERKRKKEEAAKQRAAAAERKNSWPFAGSYKPGKAEQKRTRGR